MFIVNGRQFSFVQRFIKLRSSGKLIRERAIANLDRALRELIYFFLSSSKHDPRPTTHDPRPTKHPPTTHPPTRFSLTLWARTHWANFCLFCEKICHQYSLRQVRPVIFKSTKFCQDLPNFKDAVVLPQSRTNFLSSVKSDRFVNLHVMISRKVSIKKI